MDLGPTRRSPAALEELIHQPPRSNALGQLLRVLSRGLDSSTFERALEVQRLLARRGGLHHRSVKIADLVIAAAAEAAAAVVLHYDSDYDRIAEVAGQPTHWIAPRDSL